MLERQDRRFERLEGCLVPPPAEPMESPPPPPTSEFRVPPPPNKCVPASSFSKKRDGRSSRQ